MDEPVLEQVEPEAEQLRVVVDALLDAGVPMRSIRAMVEDAFQQRVSGSCPQ